MDQVSCEDGGARPPTGKMPGLCEPSCDRETWVRLAMAAKAAGIDLDTFTTWSAQAENYSERDVRSVWIIPLVDPTALRPSLVTATTIRRSQ